ncbi:hypothetical protein BGZ63DRAFT_402159 [Mariannaea sp. PMI_226]|nr:hypothetical protein BGZ63DRAFT_402159 [Mariannaea sp. PMI_226]
MSGFEAIGAIAAAGQFVEQGSKIIRLAKSIYDQFQDAPEQVQQRLERLEDLISIAERIRQTKALQTAETERILDRCQAHAAQLQLRLEATSFKGDDPFGKKAKRAIRGVMEEEDVLQLFDTLDKELGPLGVHLGGLNLETSHNIAELIQTEFSGVKDQLNNIVRATDLSPEAEKCLKDLFITDPSIDRATLKTTKGEVLEGTCDWIGEKEAFDEWLTAKSGCLWISGGPGMGKTMLSIYLTEYLEQDLHQGEDGSSNILTYFFCDFKDDRRNDAVSILRGISFQILQQNERLIDRILPTYKIQKEKLFDKGSFETLWNIFVDMINDDRTGQALCILDGLDECHPESLEHLLLKLKQAQSTTTRFKFIVVSREHPDCLNDYLGHPDIPRIRLDPDAKEEIGAGLDQYISTRVADLAEMRNYSVELANHVKETLRKRSNGTYLWVTFVVKDLREVFSPDVEAALENFPSGLDALYERMLQLIHPQQQKLVKDILRRCTFSFRPLHPKELVSALGIQPTRLLDNQMDILQEKLKYCGHFLNASPEVVTLVHQSAYDFLTSRHQTYKVTPWFTLSNIEMEQAKLASECISYLLHFDLLYTDGQLDEENRYYSWGRWGPQEGLAIYSSEYWPDHFRLADGYCDDIIRDYSEFFSSKSPVLRRWMEFLDHASLMEGHVLLNVAARFGLSAVMKQILPEKRGLNWKSVKSFRQKPSKSDLACALHLAVQGGHMAVVEMLLESKAPTRYRSDYFFETALHCAARNGHLLITKRLLQQTPVDVKDCDGETPLNRAALRGHLQVAECLLKSGADPNGSKTRGSSSLLMDAALQSDGGEVVKLLLEWKADPKCTNEFGRTALSYAAKEGHVSAIRFLLDLGPKLGLNVNHRCEDGFTPLHYAITHGRLEATQLLWNHPGLDRYLQVDLRLSPRGKPMKCGPLELALCRGELEVLRWFLETCRMPLPEPSPDTPLGAIHLLLSTPFRDDVAAKLRFLVSQLHIDPQQRTWESGYRTPLFLAAMNTHIKAVKFLVDECNLDPSARCSGSGDTPLHAAAQHGWRMSYTSAIINFLIHERGVNVDALDDLQRTPLHYALARLCGIYDQLGVTEYESSVVQTLLKAGAQICLKDSNGCTARDLISGNHKHEIQEWFDAMAAKYHST